MGEVDFIKNKKTKLRLYITENAPHSNKAIVNLKHLLQKIDEKSYQLEILDIHKHSHMAVEDKVQVVPTLLKFPTNRSSTSKLSSKEPVRLVGDLSNQKIVKQKLELE